MLDYKSSPVAIGATGAGAIEENRGIVRGLVSTYGNLDLAGDIVEPGAFTDTLRTAGSRRVILWQHKQDEPLGVGELKDTARGLEVEVQLDKSIRRAGEALALSKMGALSFSIGYNVKSKRGSGSGPRYLTALDLAEASFVTFPANPEARILSAKEHAQAAADAREAKQLGELAASIRGHLYDTWRYDLRRLRSTVHAAQLKAIAARAPEGRLDFIQSRIDLAMKQCHARGDTAAIGTEVRAIESYVKRYCLGRAA